jgi:hypothetical protein
MASQEGAQRIKWVGKFILLIGCTIDVLVWLFLFSTMGSASLFYLALMLITPVAFGGLVYALGWILEGYSLPPRSTLPPLNDDDV